MNSAAPNQSRPAISRWRPWLSRRATSLVVLCCVAMALGRLLGSVWWVVDLINHFWPFYGVLLASTTVWLASQRRWRMAGLSAVGLIANAAAIAPYYWPSGIAEGDPLRLVVCNLLSSNPTPERALEFLEGSHADVLVLLEVHPDWMPRLKPLTEAYPYGRMVPQQGNFGIALLSRRPLSDVEQINFGFSGVPTLTAVVDEFDLRIVATHPPPPVSRGLSDRRDRQLADIARFAAESSHPVIVAGDLNATPWSTAIRPLVVQGKLRDSSLGQGLQPTWPAWGPMALLPIDHVLISRQIGVRDRLVGPMVGSDHRPVIVDLVAPH